MPPVNTHITTICPFCQSADLAIRHEGDDHWWVECGDCGARGSRAASREEAQFGWAQTSGNIQLLKMMINASPSAFVVKDSDGRFVFANEQLAKFFHTRVENIIGHRDADFIADPELASFYEQTMSRVLETGEEEIQEEKVPDPFTLQPRWFHSHKVPITLGEDKKPLVLMVTHEITELKQAHEQLIAKERRFLEAMMASGEAIWESDNETQDIVFGNDEIARILGLSPAKTVFTRDEFEGYLHPHDREDSAREFFEVLPARGRTSFQHRMVRADGDIVWVRNRVQVVARDEQGEPFRLIGSLRDITKRKEAELHLQMTRLELEQTNSHLESLVESRTSELVQLNLELQSLARTDSLIGLANRLAADESIANEFARLKRGQSQYVVMLADIDHFKRINDTWGHAAGDQALMHIASLLSANLRGSDLVARYGGEEFLMIVHTDDLASATLLAEGIRRLIEVTPLSEELAVTMSIGLAQASEHDESATDAVRRADDKLYEAKTSGRNRVLSAGAADADA